MNETEHKAVNRYTNNRKFNDKEKIHFPLELCHCELYQKRGEVPP